MLKQAIHRQFMLQKGSRSMKLEEGSHHISRCPITFHTAAKICWSCAKLFTIISGNLNACIKSSLRDQVGQCWLTITSKPWFLATIESAINEYNLGAFLCTQSLCGNLDFAIRLKVPVPDQMQVLLDIPRNLPPYIATQNMHRDVWRKSRRNLFRSRLIWTAVSKA